MKGGQMQCAFVRPSCVYRKMVEHGARNRLGCAALFYGMPAIEVEDFQAEHVLVVRRDALVSRS